MILPKLRVVKNEDQQSAEIFLYGIVGDYWDWENDSPVTARNLQRRLAELNDYPIIHLRLNGPGGDVHEGLLIVNIIKASKKIIHTWNDGICASMMAIILASVPLERRHAAKASLTMLHRASTGAWGNSDALRDAADMLDKHDDVLIDILCDALELTPDGVKNLWFDGKDHWLTAQEGEKAGLFKVEDYEIAEIPDNPQNMQLDKIAAFFHAKNKPQNQLIKNETMLDFTKKFKKLTALAKVAAADITNEMVSEINDEIEKADIPGVTLVLDSFLEEVTNKADDLETKVDDLEMLTKAKDQQIKDLLKTVSDQKKELGKPAEDAKPPITDQIDSTGTPPVVDEFETSYDRELKARYKG